MENILKIAKKLNIPEDQVLPFGYDKAKINLDYYKSIESRKDAKLVLVTAITPTKAGEGKTTTSIGLQDALSILGKKSVLCLREPSLGPVFGLKGGAVGGGKSLVVPAEDINLHFTGDFHALTSAINLISAVIDNHIFQGNELNIDPNNIVWKRALDMNDRALRSVQIALGEKNGTPRIDHFQITVASEMMAVLCICKDKADFKERVSNILVAYTYDKKPIYVKDLKITGAIMKLMNGALSPNLVQTLEGNPCIIHGGPFANIAHGCNSIIATKMGLKLGDIVVTEAGFAADLGAEKFFDIKCRTAGLKPDAVVLVATIRALKLHGGVLFDQLDKENLEALKIGVENLKQHAENLKKFGVPFVISINKFYQDTNEEVAFLKNWCIENGYMVAFSTNYENGGKGAIELGEKVIEILETKKSYFNHLYSLDESLEEKINKICKEIYHADGVEYTDLAKQNLKVLIEMGKNNLPVCIAKTPNSFSDNPKLLNVPKGFKVTVRDVSLSNGAGFVVAYLGDVMTMPGLPKVPLATKMED